MRQVSEQHPMPFVNAPTVARPPARHPAKFTDTLLPAIAKLLRPHVRPGYRVLDPFAGVGKIFLLNQWYPGMQIEGIEIEPEWAAQHPRTTLGNALALPWADSHFDAIVTSPTYGNRMADSHTARDSSRRNTYTHAMGRKLHADNSGAMQWGESYRRFHKKAWTEAKRVLRPGGVFILNIKDHIRKGQRVRVTDWHVAALEGMGFSVVQHEQINCPGNGFGQNGSARVPYESLIKFVLPAHEGG